MLDEGIVFLTLAFGWLCYFSVRFIHNLYNSSLMQNEKASILTLLIVSIAHPFLLLFVVQSTISVFYPMRTLSPLSLFLGEILFWGGFFVILYSHKTLQGNYQPAIVGKGAAHLVTRGPYRIVRHPLYAGSLIMWIGTEISLWSLWVLFAILLLPLIIWQIHYEEKMLYADFKEEWDHFAKQTPYKLIPFIF